MLSVPVLNVLLLSPKFQCQGGLRDNSWRSSGPVFLAEARFQALLEEGTWGPLQVGRWLSLAQAAVWCWWVSSEGERISNGLRFSHAPRMHAVSMTCTPDLPWGPPFKTLPTGKQHAWPPAVRGLLAPLQVNLLTFPSWVPFGRGVQLVTRMYYRFHTAKAGLWQQLCSSRSPRYLWKFCRPLLCFIGGNKNKNKHKASF